MKKFKYTEKCREISGFGGGYEKGCRKMVIAGMKWFEANPDAKPIFKCFKDVYGIILDENDDARNLMNAMNKAVDDGCSGAMMQATVSHVRYAHQFGWDNYICEMEKEK